MAAAQQAAGADKQKLQKINDIRTKVTAFRAQMGRFATEIDTLLAEAAIPEDERGPFHPAFPADTAPPLARRETELNTAISQRLGATDNPAGNTIRWLQQQIAALEKQETADKARQERIRTIQARLAAIDTELERINSEIAQIEGPQKERRKVIRDERVAAYVGYFDNLKLEQETLATLYAPVSARLTGDAATEQEQDLEFSIRWVADIKQWVERGSVLFDQRKAIPYGTLEGIEEATSRILAPAWTSGDSDQIAPAMEEFLAEFRKLPPAKYMRAGVTVQDIFDWLYEVEHVRLSYGIKYNGTDLEKLSPGTKGIVLLILYLGMDVKDTRPLIVDQPDENLDNESIYALLTSYFRSAKKRRQIILITHNPNLVVNADSEQVIVATAERRENGMPHISYSAGSLENNTPEGHGIKQRVCRILEGGSDAFRKREIRYSLVKA